ncbi:MAG: DUF4139 domain-containing protein [Bacteroidetes bacterium]|nr:DUF4139 domain-containing protein [Bacteroidota bacterium]
MKKITLLFLFGSSAVQTFAGDKEIVKSTLSDVTIYAQGAQLHHKANFNYKVGVTEIIVEGISPYIDAKSIQVKATGAVVILDSKYTLYYPQVVQATEDGIPLKIKRDISLLKDSLRTIGYEIQEIEDELSVLNATKSIIISNGVMRSQGKVNDSLNLLKSAVDYYTLKLTELNKKILILNKRKQEKQEKKSQMDLRMYNLENFQNQSRPAQPNNSPIPRIVVTIQSKEVGAGKLSLSYVASNAGWTPLYDLRSDATTGKLSLTYKAQVYQNTGLDWNDVKISISTNNPKANKTKPELNPWYIDYNSYRAEQKDKKRNLDYLTQPSAVPNAVFNSGFSFSQTLNNSNEDIQGLTSDQFTTVVHQLIAAEFKIDLPYTIKSNNDQHMVLIKQAELNTSFKYFAVPKMDAGVFLVAQMTKLDELQLVPAKANIFFDGTYIGETYIDPTQMDDTLNLSLGKDPNIVVKRTLVKKDCKDKIISDRIERIFAYSIEAKNNKSSTIELIIQDQLPLTTNGDITIEAMELSKGELDTRTGTIEWKMTLKPKDSKLLDYKFKVKHNKDKQIAI